MSTILVDPNGHVGGRPLPVIYLATMSKSHNHDQEHVIGARVLGDFGDDPERYCDAKSRKLRGHIAHHPSVWDQTGRTGSQCPEQTARRCRLPVGVWGLVL